MDRFTLVADELMRVAEKVAPKDPSFKPPRTDLKKRVRPDDIRREDRDDYRDTVFDKDLKASVRTAYKKETEPQKAPKPPPAVSAAQEYIPLEKVTTVKIVVEPVSYMIYAYKRGTVRRINKPYYRLEDVRKCVAEKSHQFIPRLDHKTDLTRVPITEQEALQVINSLTSANFKNTMFESGKSPADCYKYRFRSNSLVIPLYIKFYLENQNTLLSIISFHKDERPARKRTSLG